MPLPENHGAVLFDIDGTLLDTSLERTFLEFLIEIKALHPGAIAFRALRNIASAKWRLRYWKSIYTAGLNVKAINSLMDTWWEDKVKPHLFEGMMDGVRYFQKHEYTLIFVSGTFLPLATFMAKRLSVNHVIASHPKVNQGHWTGILEGPSPVGIRKREYVIPLLQRLNIVTDSAWGFGNRYFDRFFLELTRYPVVVRPGQRLDRLAQKRGWMIIHDPVKTLDWVGITEDYAKARPFS